MLNSMSCARVASSSKVRGLIPRRISSGTVKTIEEFLLKFLPAINGLGLQVNIPVKCVPSQRTSKLFYPKFTMPSSIATSLDKVGNMLPWVPFAIKLMELWWLIIGWHDNGTTEVD
uniref:Uncharacterized protein LOC104211764 n=1 Tax=Nicotiana sylvestris TaxID=4096 RepID=A0A1U7USY5_NICSY|nr:PREDICTED: uncharacterized protein LOC104211764 [Nicotiana sylvestris]